MLRRFVTSALAVLCLSTLAAHAQEAGPWFAASSNAKAITGDISISGYSLSINFAKFPLAEIRLLTPQELTSAFDANEGEGAGHLYRLDIPPTRRFQHHNTLCGSDPTEWMATYVSGRTLELAFFSGQQPPTLSLEAMTNSTSHCGTFTYTH